MSDLRREISDLAIQLGFSKVGFTRAVPLEKEFEYLRTWLDNGFQGEMRWMEREPEKRADPIKYFPEAKSVIVFALNYYTPFQHDDNNDIGKISRYAWGNDYHEIVKTKLREIAEFIKQKSPEAVFRDCCDTSPVMDKAWAVRAGIGWLGKHSNVISKEIGSWFFIGELFTNIEFDEYDTPETDHCGNCTACIDACPTGAIVQPLVVDAQSCLSYATIELRVPTLPTLITENQENWLYGCDICQDVCPWNRFQTETSVKDFRPRNGETGIALETAVKISDDDFSARFRNSPIKRTKAAGLRRNAAALLETSRKDDFPRS